MTLEVKAPAPDWSTGSRPRENTGVAGNPAPIFTAAWRPPQGYPDWSESLLPATGLARIIAGDSLHQVWSPALSAPRLILRGQLPPARFHRLAAPPRQDDSFG